MGSLSCGSYRKIFEQLDKKYFKMWQLKLLLLVTGSSAYTSPPLSKLFARTARAAPSPRLEKSLVGQFPFHATEQHEDDHGDHAHHHEGDHTKTAGTSINSILARQGYGPSDDEEEPGKKCVQKVMMVEETVWEDHETCQHSYDKRCHKSYTTTYSSQQEEECDEVFRKICYIEMVDIANNVTTQVCRKPLVKDCPGDGEPVCRTEYQSECWSKQIPHEVEDDVAECVTVQDRMCKEETSGYTTKEKCEDWPRQECTVVKKKVTKFTTMTGCNKEPTELCAPAGCGFREGAEECHDVVKTHIQEKPEEECTLEPVKTCKHITRLVPKLVEVQECVDVPKEICNRSKQNPRKVKKPIIKNWCYTPSEEDDLQSL